MKTISLIIPAYNEEKTIENTINISIPLLKKELLEIIVVNDCSSDNTLKILKKFREIRLIDNKKNLWKSASVAKAIEKSKWDYIFLVDADLINLKTKDLEDMIEPIKKKEAGVSISFLKNSWPLFPFKKIDYCSGQRVIEKNILMSEIEKIRTFPSYSLEWIINNLIIKNKLKIKVVYWKEVENRYNTKDLWFIVGLKKIIKIWSEIMKWAWWFFAMYKVNIELKKLLVKK